MPKVTQPVSGSWDRSPGQSDPTWQGLVDVSAMLCPSIYTLRVERKPEKTSPQVAHR